MKIVINFHAYGNLFIVPFNFDDAENQHLQDKFPIAAQFYEHLWKDAGLPPHNVKGNGATTVGYTANGEASDYMLEELGVYSMSPELGTDDKSSQTFFIKNWETLNSVVTQNYVWIKNTVK